MLDLGVGRTPVDDRQLGKLGNGRPAAAARIDRDPRSDGQDPRAQVLAVLEPVVGAQRAEERLLECIVRRVAGHPPAEKPEHDLAVLEVEALERRNRRHCFHHPSKRGGGRNCETGSMRVGVVGHVEWVEFARVEELPRPGGIVHASETWSQAGGGGGVAALQLARLGADIALFTAFGDDDRGRRARAELATAGVRVEATLGGEPQRRAFCHVDAHGERSITVLGDKLRPRGADGELPWEELDRADAVYFVSGDAKALQQARRARILVATSRELETLRTGGVRLDALVGSGEDEGERYQPGDLEPPPDLVVSTAGALGGWAQPGGPYQAVPPPGPVKDSYGCGDCFAAGLTYALAEGRATADALAFAARCGAAALTGRGVFAAPIAL